MLLLATVSSTILYKIFSWASVSPKSANVTMINNSKVFLTTLQFLEIPVKKTSWRKCIFNNIFGPLECVHLVWQKCNSRKVLFSSVTNKENQRFRGFFITAVSRTPFHLCFSIVNIVTLALKSDMKYAMSNFSKQFLQILKQQHVCVWLTPNKAGLWKNILLARTKLFNKWKNMFRN